MQRFFQRVAALFAELRRRKVYQAAVVYLFGAYALLELSDIVLPALGAPDDAIVVVLIALAAGFPVALLLGWMYDFTDKGLQRDPGDRKRPPDTRRRAKVVAAVAVAASAVLLAWGAWMLKSGSEVAAAGVAIPDHDPRRIAVLYFDDHSRDGSLGYLAAGLTESLLHELGTVPGLQVTARNSVKPFRHRAIATDSLVELLGVGTLVEGSVTRSGERVRAVVQLIDARSEKHLDSRVVEGAVAEPFAFQDSVAVSVGRALRRHLGQEIRLSGARRGTSSTEAWLAYRRGAELVGVYEASTSADTRERQILLRRADTLFTAAARLDEEWLEPELGRLDVARQLAAQLAERPGTVDTTWARETVERANHVLEQWPEAAEARAVRGWVRLRLSTTPGAGRRGPLLAAAEQDLNRAVELNPELSDAWWLLSELLIQRSRFSEAVDAATRAFDTDVFLEVENAAVLTLFNATLQLGPRDEAIRWCDEGRRRFPEKVNFVRCKLLILGTFPQVEPDVERAWELYRELLDLSSERSYETWRLFGGTHVAQVLARAGLPDSAQAVLQAVRGHRPPAHLAAHEAKVHLLLGDEQEAIRLLRLYLTYDADTTYLARDWWFEGLRGNHEFRRLVGLDPGPG